MAQIKLITAAPKTAFAALVGRLSCVECKAISDRDATEWIVGISGGYDQGPLELLTFCPACADRERIAG